MKFEISSFMKIKIEGNDCVQFVLRTDKGEGQFIEWLNNGKVERTDSHIRISQLDLIESLFDLSEKPSFMPSYEYLDLNEIYDALDAKL